MNYVFSSYVNVLKNSFNFDGKSDKYEYLHFMLLHIVTSILIYIPCLMLDNFIVFAIYLILFTLPICTLHIRRLNDLDKPCELLFTYLIPIVGPIWLLKILIE